MDAFKVCNALGNEVRYRIVKALRDRSIRTCCDRIEFYENGASVGDVVQLTGLAQATVSQHLKVLEQAGLVTCEKRGTWSCFFLNTGAIDALVRTLQKDFS
jgi:DNA-binding transcriptional ArsR family regulator